MEMEIVMEEGEDFMSENTTIENEEDISQLCRICANSNEYLIPIFRGEGLEHELKDKISIYLSIKVLETDKLPTQLCYQCASTLIAWHDLVSGCVEADKKLNALFQNMNPSESEAGVGERSKTVYLTENNTVRGSPSSASKRIGTNIKSEEGITNHLMGSGNEDETEKIVVFEEEVTTMEPDIEEEVSSDLRDNVIVKTEDLGDMVPDVILKEEMDVSGVEEEVEAYEDVETSVVVHEFIEGLEEGEYIAYFGDDYVESSVEVINQDEAEETTETEAYICEICSKVFTSIAAFKTHYETHRNQGLHFDSNQKKHSCHYCNAIYKRTDHLQKHIEIMHPDTPCAQIPKEKKVNPYAKTFLCNTCGKILKSSAAYENHTLKHQSKCPFLCSICSESFPNRGARRRHEVKEHNVLTKENGNPDGYHVCEICGLEMFSDGAYYHHKDKHGDPYPCGFCGKLYGSRSLMQVHARRHTTERPFVCTICNRNFKVKQELNAHMNIHKDIRPYQCPHCPKMCRKSSDLTHHIRTHTGEKPFICDKCGRGFAQAGDMRKHRLLHFRPSKINKNMAVKI